MHLILNPVYGAKTGNAHPVWLIWFIQGWNGYDFTFSPEQQVFANGNIDLRYRGVVMNEQAQLLAKSIQREIDELGGLSDAIEILVNVGNLIWREDV